MHYYSAVAERLVTRLGTTTYIGASVSIIQTGARKGETQIDWDLAVIAAIPDDEYARNAREYMQLVREGSLRERTEAEFKALGDAHDAAVKKETAEREAAAKKVEAEAVAEAKAAEIKVRDVKAEADKMAKAEAVAAEKVSSEKATK